MKKKVTNRKYAQYSTRTVKDEKYKLETETEKQDKKVMQQEVIEMRSEEKGQQTRRIKLEAKTRGRGECAKGIEIRNRSRETTQEGQAAGSRRNEV